MSFFSSDRERRLWLWTLVIIAGILATLGFSWEIALKLFGRYLLDNLFFNTLFLIGAAIVALAWRIRPRGAEIGVGLGIIAVYFLLFLRLSLPAERTHLIEYSVVGAFVYAALRERADNRHVPFPALLAVLLSSLVGIVDETMQIFLPNRVFDPIDIGFNILASVMAVAGSAALRWAQHQFV